MLFDEYSLLKKAEDLRQSIKKYIYDQMSLTRTDGSLFIPKKPKYKREYNEACRLLKEIDKFIKEFKLRKKNNGSALEPKMLRQFSDQLSLLISLTATNNIIKFEYEKIIKLEHEMTSKEKKFVQK